MRPRATARRGAPAPTRRDRSHSRHQGCRLRHGCHRHHHTPPRPERSTSSSVSCADYSTHERGARQRCRCSPPSRPGCNSGNVRDRAGARGPSATGGSPQHPYAGSLEAAPTSPRLPNDANKEHVQGLRASLLRLTVSCVKRYALIVVLAGCGSSTPPPAAPPPSATPAPPRSEPALSPRPAAPLATSAPVEDPYLWLEQVEDGKSLDWAKAQNAKSRSALEAVPGFDDNLSLIHISEPTRL